MLKKILVLVLIAAVIWPASAWGLEDNPLAKGIIEGRIQKIAAPDAGAAGDNGGMTIETYGGAVYTLQLSPDCSFTIDNIPVRREALRRGMEVYGRLDGGEILTLEAYSTVKTGYIQPGSRVIVGAVVDISSEQIKVRRDEGLIGTYFTNPAIPVTRRSETINFDQLYVGDRVKLYFDEMDSTVISRIEVEGPSVMVKDVYKGTLKAVDESGQHLTLSDVQVLRNSLWQASLPSWRVDYTNDLPVYAGGQKIPLHNLKYYRGRSIYVVTKNALGRECIDRLVVKSQYEAAYQAQVKDVNWFSDTCELSNNKNVSFNDGSIIIRDGRLQDKSVLTAGTDAYFITDSIGEKRLVSVALIYNAGINNSSAGQTAIYYGQLSDVFEDSFWIEDPYQLKDNSWDDVGKMEFFMDSDTSICDLVYKKTITMAEFTGGDYSVDEDSDRAEDYDLEDWYAYVVAMGDRAACIGLFKEEVDEDDLEAQRVTSGTIDRVINNEAAGWEISLRDSSDWSERKEKWMAKNSNVKIGVAGALIIRNGKTISPGQLKAGERLYIVRDDYFAKVVLVK